MNRARGHAHYDRPVLNETPQLAYLDPLLMEQREHLEYQNLLDRAEEGMIEKSTALPIKNKRHIDSLHHL